MTDRAVQLDAVFNDIAKKIPHGRVTPSNITKVQRQFSRKQESVSFIYDPLSSSIYEVIRELEAFSILEKGAIYDLLREKQQELLSKAQMIASVGTTEFTRRSLKVYPKPTKSLVEKAYEYLKLEDVPKSPRISRTEARRVLRNSMKSVGFVWKIKNEQMITSAKVDTLRRVVVLRDKERFRKKFVDRLAVHEIGTHAARAENGRMQPYIMFATGLPKYLDTEEGLAAYNEERAGILDNTTLRNYAGRVIAVHLALDHSFLVTYRKLRKYFPKKTAIKLTARAKRGLLDPNQPGAFTRDATYLRGYLQVKNYVEKQGGWVHDLMLGKIGIQHVDLVKTIPGVIPARFLPEPIFKLIGKD